MHFYKHKDNFPNNSCCQFSTINGSCMSSSKDMIFYFEILEIHKWNNDNEGLQSKKKKENPIVLDLQNSHRYLGKHWERETERKRKKLSF